MLLWKTLYMPWRADLTECSARAMKRQLVHVHDRTHPEKWAIRARLIAAVCDFFTRLQPQQQWLPEVAAEPSGGPLRSPMPASMRCPITGKPFCIHFKMPPPMLLTWV